MTGLQELQQAKDAGFSEQEIGEWLEGERQKALSSGFSQEEFDSYWGRPHFDTAPVKDYTDKALQLATKPTAEGGPSQPLAEFTDALKAGFGESVTGLLLGKPTTQLPPNAPRSSRIASQVATLAGDVPAMIGGYFAGGANPITGTAGAFALPAGIRRIMMDKYANGEVTGFSDFWNRFSGAFIDAAKGYVTGLATAKVGQLIGKIPIPSPTLKTGATLTGEIGTMVTVGKALEGQVPEPDDFIDTALALGFVKGSIKAAEKLRNIYAATGVKPEEVAQDVKKDPTILQDLGSETTEIPKSYRRPQDNVPPTPRTPEQKGRYLLALQGKLALPGPAKGLEGQLAKASENVFEGMASAYKTDLGKAGWMSFGGPSEGLGQELAGKLGSDFDNIGVIAQASKSIEARRDARKIVHALSDRVPDDQKISALTELQLESAGTPEAAILSSAIEKLRPKTVSDIHRLADQRGIKWDNDPAFMDLTERVTGKRHLDDLTQEQLNNVASAIAKEGQQTIDVPPPTVGERPIIGREVSPEDDAPLFNLSQRMPGLEQGEMFTELSRADQAITPRHEMPIDQNAEMLARAEKALADVEMAGSERGGLFFMEQEGKGGSQEVRGLQSATADWYKEATTGPKKLSQHRVEVALRKIIDDKGRDVGSDVQRIKELILGDPEYEMSPYAPKSEEEWARARQYAITEWEPDMAFGGGAPPPTPGLPGPTATPPPPPKPPKPTTKAEDAVLARVQFEEPKQHRTLDDVYTSIFDNLHPINAALRGIRKQHTPVGDNPYALERLTRGTYGKGQEFLEHGAFDFETYETVTRGYKEIMKPVKDDLKGFIAYMMSKRAIEKAEQGIETGIPLDAAKEVVKNGKEKYEKVHRERIEYRNALLDYLHDAGILSTDALEAMKQANKEYVPFYRFFEDETGRSATAKGVRQPIKKMTGGTEKILDPIVSDIKDTFLFIGLAEKNAARQAFVKLGPEVAEKQKAPVRPINLTEPEIEKLFKEFVTIRKKTEKTKTSETSTTTGGTGEEASKQTKIVVDRVKEALLARGFQPGEADQMIRRVGEAESGKIGATTEKVIKEINSTTYVPELDIRLPNEAATLWRTMRQPLGKDEIAVYTNGKREVYKVDPKVAEAFEDMDRVSANILTNMLIHTPAELLRAGVVLSPDYMGRNILRDAVASFVYAGSNPVKTALGMKSLIQKDTAFHNWMKGGGANATMVAMDRDYIQNHIMQLDQDTGLMHRAWNVAKSPLDILRAASELIENATRLGAVRSDLLKSKDKARIQALALLAREATVDFSRHGRDTQEFSRMTAFFNPALQGVDRFARAIKDNPTATLAKAFASVTLPSLLLWWANQGDEEIANLPRWQKDLFWLVRVPLPNGGSYIQRIPKSHEIGLVFGSLPERLLDDFIKDNPTAYKGISESFLKAFLPGIIPTAAVPVVEQFANRSTFTDQTLIPAHLEKLLPEYQYTEYTTETAKALGQLIGAFPGMEKEALQHDTFSGVARALTTPILIENYIRAWTGGMGQYALQLADSALRKTGVVPDPVLPARTLADIPFVKAFVARYPSASAQSIQDFHDQFTQREKYFATIQQLSREGDERAMSLMDKHSHTMMRLTGMEKALTEQGKLTRDIYKNPDMSASDKRQLIDQIYYTMIQISQFGLELMRDFEKEAP